MITPWERLPKITQITHDTLSYLSINLLLLLLLMVR